MPDTAFRLAFTNGLMSESMALWFGCLLSWLYLHRNMSLYDKKYGRKAADGAIAPEDMREMTRELLKLNIVRRVMGDLDVNKSKDMDKFRGKLRKCAEWIENHPEYQDKSWDFHHETPPHSIGIFYYFTRKLFHEKETKNYEQEKK